MKTFARLSALGAVLVGVFAPRAAAAAGFLIYDLSGEAVGRGSAVAAHVDEPAAVWFNPAALAFSEGIKASAGGVFVSARSRFAPTAGGAETNSERGNFFLPTLFASARINQMLAVGMGVYTAFGIGIKWPQGWIGRESAIAASLQTLAFNPSVALQLDPRVSVAVGFDAIRGAVDFTNGLPAIIGGDARLAGGTWGYGWNAGVLYRVVADRLHLAATFRSRVKMSFDGRADFSPASRDFEPMLTDQPGSAAITLPDIITVGVMGRPRADLALSFDTNLVLWSTYDRIAIDFQTAPDRAIVPNGHNSLTLRLGADWASPWQGVNIRAGLIFDQAAIPSDNLGPGLPDGNRIDGTLGAGYQRGFFKADIGYMFIYFLPRDATTGREGPAGTYHTLAQLVGLTVAASWR